jgi:hypothetical protein
LIEAPNQVSRPGRHQLLLLLWPSSVEATVILLGEDVYKYALPSLFLFHFVTKLSPSITILELTNCRWKGGEGKHCGRGTLQEHWLCRLTQRRHTRTMKLNRNSPGMTIHTHTHSQGLEKIRKTSSHSSFVPLSSLSFSDCIYIHRLDSSFFLMIFTLQPPSLFLLCSSWFGTRKKRTQLSLE